MNATHYKAGHLVPGSLKPLLQSALEGSSLGISQVLQRNLIPNREQSGADLRSLPQGWWRGRGQSKVLDVLSQAKFFTL